ncbi:HhH-GPD family base excision DNA repair protein [Dipodascopsis tothii]|uniref:HhH-GPD family base excision DNA repair protein n=1 Tax=Dipodascopsis tothii TaxID=44089 RepID=UPI0034CDB15C
MQTRSRSGILAAGLAAGGAAGGAGAARTLTQTFRVSKPVQTRTAAKTTKAGPRPAPPILAALDVVQQAGPDDPAIKTECETVAAVAAAAAARPPPFVADPDVIKRELVPEIDRTVLVQPKGFVQLDVRERAIKHLAAIDPRFGPFMQSTPCSVFDPATMEQPFDPFESLASSIISQQVSGAAARSIKAKFIALFNADGGSRFPTPLDVVSLDGTILRTAGLSGRKAEYILDLASRFVSAELNAHSLLTASDDDVIAALTKVKGIGVWSAQMFLMFSLKRSDVLPTGDLGVQRGMAQWVGRNIAAAKGKSGKFKYMSEADMIATAEPYRPYRSVFCWYMWRAADVIVPIGEGTTDAPGASLAPDAVAKKARPAKAKTAKSKSAAPAMEAQPEVGEKLE